ncbi:MAG: phosphoribosylglycinamide formyltransferase [Bacteroidetes bacterium]|nr:phosphoribosylglycinamide formyltransferase [Bacteroidota bacterium]
MLKVGVFVSGRGSNLRAILNSSKLHKLIKVQAVISNKATCPAFKIAEEYSINQYVVGNEEKSISYNNLSKFLKSLEIDLVVLAGFLKMIPNDMILDFRNRIINIHPALLPSFGGKEMYGMNVHKAVYESSAQVSGATVHFVDETYDTGNIIVQRCVDISDVDSPEEILEKVLAVEHELLPYVIEKFALDKIIVSNGRVKVLS